MLTKIETKLNKK